MKVRPGIFSSTILIILAGSLQFPEAIASVWWEVGSTVNPALLLIPDKGTQLHLADTARNQKQTEVQRIYQRGIALQKTSSAEAYETFRSLLPLARSNREWAIFLKSVNQLGFIADGQQQELEAFHWAREARHLVQRESLDSLDVADLFYVMGYSYYALTSEFDSAIFCYTQSATIRIKILGEWSEQVARCYNAVGDVYKFKKFDFLEAEKALERSLEIRERIGSKDLLRLTSNYYSLAATNRSQRDYQKAIAYGSKTIELAKETGDLRFLDRTYSMMANIYRDMNLFQKAKEYYRLAIDLHSKANEQSEILANYYTNLGETFHRDGDTRQSIANYRIAYKLFNQKKPDDQMPYVHLLQLMAKEYSLNNDRELYWKINGELLFALRNLNLMNSRSAAEVFEQLGDHFFKEQRLDSALRYCQKGLSAGIPEFHPRNDFENPLMSDIGSNFYVYQLLYLKARVLESLFESERKPLFLEKGIECILLAERLLGTGRNTLDMEESKWNFVSDNFGLYETAISLLYELSVTVPSDTLLNRAFYFFERSKAQSLARAITEAGQLSREEKEDTLLSRQENDKRMLFTIQDQLSRELASPSPDQVRIAYWQREVVKLDRSIQHNRRRIEERFPGYFKVKYDVTIPQVTDIQQLMREQSSFLLDYFWGSTSIFALGVGDRGIAFKKVGSRDSIQSIAKPFLAHLTSEQASLDYAEFVRFKSSAYQLYNSLVKPFGPLMVNIRGIRIIPDGPIRQVPFEALIKEENKAKTVAYQNLKYLVKEFEIGYAYSSLLLTESGDNRSRVPSMLAMGFTGSDPGKFNNSVMANLPGSKLELESLARRFEKGTFLLNKEATENKFKELAPQFDIVHLAIHGKGDPLQDYSSSLFFSREGDSEDGELHAYELYGLKLKATLAVLGSCESGLGKAFQGEGMISMASAFAYAGCETVMLSLWKVQDEVAAKFMDSFYEEQQRGSPVDRALSETKRKYLVTADELGADPRIWAPLVSYGNQRPVFKEERSKMIYFSIGIGLILLFFLIQKLRSRT